jgi:hypothetical protein
LSAEQPGKLRELQELYADWCDEVDADCRQLGIEPPTPGRVRKSTSVSSAVGEFEQTESFPGFNAVDEFRYVGYQAIRTRSHFGRVTAEMPDQETGEH